MGFDPYLDLIAQGEPVSAGVANRPTRELQQNLQYLWDVFQASGLGAAQVRRQVPLEPEAQAGMPVYWNALAGRFERALAVAGATGVGGTLEPAASAQSWGVVQQKTSAAIGDLLVSGYATLDLTVAGGGAAGLYYLSSQTPGMLTQTRPALAVPVLRADGQGNVLVLATVADALERHVHYRFELACRPAGTTHPPAAGHRHVITAADATLPGWLPADHASFGGHAPAGFAFGYNLAVDADLNSAWPPLPAVQASLEWNKGLTADVSGTLVPLGLEGLAILDRYGIWWKSDCYGEAPWPVHLDTLDEGGFSASLSHSAYPCPRQLEMGMVVWFTRVNFATEAAVVTSLSSRSPRLLVTCPSGVPATGGDLVLDLDLDLTVTTDAPGDVVLKSFDPATATFAAGPVVEGLFVGSDNVVLAGTTVTELPDGPTIHQGLVAVSVIPDPSRELDVELVRVDVVTEESFQDLLYLGFPAADESSIRSKIQVPATGTPATPQLTLRFWLLGRLAGTLPALTLTARRLPRPDGTAVEDLPLTGDEFAVTIDTTATLAAANQYVEVEAEPFDVEAGDVVFFTLARGASDGYPGQVGLLRQVGLLSGVGG